MRGHHSSTFLVQRKKVSLQLSKYSFFEVFFFLAPLTACSPETASVSFTPAAHEGLLPALRCFPLRSLRGQEHLPGAAFTRSSARPPAGSCVRHQAVPFCLISQRGPVAAPAPDLRLPRMTGTRVP